MSGSSLSEGDVIAGRYRVVRPLSRGGMGAVYEVIDSQTNRRRALKVLLESVAMDDTTRERFRRESTVAGRVESDHVIEVIDAGVDEATQMQFLVMELLRQGEDLAAVLGRRGSLPQEEVVHLLAQVALGLDKVHAEGIAHRDLKLENLFLQTRDDGSTVVKILDFGVAKVFEGASGPLNTTQAVGTPLYMAPEQLTGDALVDRRADLYALGHLAFTLLTGTAYFQPELTGVKSLYPFMMKVMEGPTESASDRARKAGAELPPGFDAWFAQAASKDAEERFESARLQIAELAIALDTAVPPMLRTSVVSDPPPRPRSPSMPDSPSGTSTTAVVAGPRSPTSSKRRAVTATVGVAAAALILLLAVRLTSTEDEPTEPSRPSAAALQPEPPEVQPDPEPSSRADAAPIEQAPSATPSASAPRAPAAAAPPAGRAAPPRPPAKTPKPKPEYDPLDEL